MKVLELSGVNIGQKIRVTYKLQRKNAKQHVFEGYVTLLKHDRLYSQKVDICLSKYPLSNYREWHEIPYYADVEIIE